MRLKQPAFVVMALALWLTNSGRVAPARESSILGIFVGTTPCGQMIRPLHKIPLQKDCALIEWKLVLYQDPVSRKPTTYKLSSVNRFIVKGTNLYSDPALINTIEGKWIIVEGIKTKPRSTVYRLDPGKSKISVDILKLNDNLFHLLDHNGNLMVGNPFWSYTLSRVKTDNNLTF